MNWELLDAVACAELVRSGAAPADAATCAALQRLEAHAGLNAVTQRLEQHAREQLENGIPMGLLAGVPLLLKDTLEYPGFPYTEASRWFGGRIGQTEPAWVRAVRAEGAVIIGKTNAPEFGLMDVTEPLATGPTLNPWNARLTAGGSSGGAAAAVAAGLTPIAHGSDGGGSIRYPAACCGIFGFKPSRGRTTPVEPTFDARLPSGVVQHVLTRSVRDSALVLAITEAALAGQPGDAPRRWVREPATRRLRVAVIDTPTHGGALSPRHGEALDDACGLLAQLGHTVVRAHWPIDMRAQHAAFFDRWAYGVHLAVQRFDEVNRIRFLDTVEPFTRGLAAKGARLGSERVGELIEAGLALTAAMEAFHREWDVLLTPVSAVHPVALGDHAPGGDFETTLARVADNVAFTYVQNIAGQAAMSVPLHWSSDHLPVGVQLAAAQGQDEALLRLAYQLEYTRPWQQRRPPGTTGTPSP